jgi:hypothetical protein
MAVLRVIVVVVRVTVRTCGATTRGAARTGAARTGAARTTTAALLGGGAARASVMHGTVAAAARTIEAAKPVADILAGEESNSTSIGAKSLSANVVYLDCVLWRKRG